MDAVELTRELIKIESTDPGSWETRVGEYICNYLKESGADTETYEVEPGRKIVKGVVKGAKAHPALVFICHMDTVPIAGGWTKNPLGEDGENGRFFGRGSCDMKSGLASALCAFLEVAAQMKETGKAPKRTLKWIGTCDEEGDMTGVERVIELGW